MSIEVNGVQYEGILFAKLADEGYIEAKSQNQAMSHTMTEQAQAMTHPESSEMMSAPDVTSNETGCHETHVTVAPTSPVENAQSPQT